MWQVGVLPANHRASEYALEVPRMAIAVLDELQERGTEALYGRVWQFGDLPANHRASEYALEARRMAIAVPDELQESVGPGSNRALTAVCGRSVSIR